MSGSRPGSVLQQLRRALAHAPGAEVSDAELLECFVKTGDQAAFELLVWRHERMVFGVCRRVLGNLHDAEDAFQATFLVLARKAASIGNRQAVAGWLHRVASRVAHHARYRASRRERPGSHDANFASLPCPREPGAELLVRDLRLVLDEEVARLPEKYRVPVVLCYLEGKTYEEAARQLGCPKGTLSARLTRARGMLWARLTRRGIGIGAGLLAAVLCEHTAAAAVPTTLVAATVKAALRFAEGKAATAGLLSAQVASLVTEGLQAMGMSKLKVGAALLLAGILASGAAALTHRMLALKLAEGQPEKMPAGQDLGTERLAAKGQTDRPQPAAEKEGATFSVTVRAVDANQKPVAKADVDLVWLAKDGAMTGAAQKPMVTDAAGKALLTMETWLAKSLLKHKQAVVVFSADRKLGGITGVGQDDNGKELTVTLGPTVRVKAKLECKELNLKPDWTVTTVTADGFTGSFARNESKSAGFEFVLPAGKYLFHSSTLDDLVAEQTVTLTADRPEYDLGTTDMKASAIARLKGKAAPEWVIAGARGVKADVKLSDYKGKWVYLEFWGFW